MEAGIGVYNPFVRRSPHGHMISHSCKGSQQSSYTGHMATFSTLVLIQKKERANTKRHPDASVSIAFLWCRRRDAKVLECFYLFYNNYLIPCRSFNISAEIF